jgi:hypothetical protein
LIAITSKFTASQNICCAALFVLLAKVLPKREKKNQIFENEARDWRSSISERKKSLKNHRIPIVGFQCVAINIKG